MHSVSPKPENIAIWFSYTRVKVFKNGPNICGGHPQADHSTSKFLKDVFHNSYLVHSFLTRFYITRCPPTLCFRNTRGFPMLYNKNSRRKGWNCNLARKISHKLSWSSILTSRHARDNFTYPIVQLYNVSIRRNRYQILPTISARILNRQGMRTI